MNPQQLQAFYHGKTVLVTGSTGLLGYWLCILLLRLGANVHGIARTKRNDKQINHQHFHLHGVDLTESDSVAGVFSLIKPDMVFHLAGCNTVGDCTKNPANAMVQNVSTTINVLEGIRNAANPVTGVFASSGSLYGVNGDNYGHREIDTIAAQDIYSGTKVAMEGIIQAYCNQFFSPRAGKDVGIVRSCNLVGGGDLAKSRLIADCCLSFANHQPVVLGNGKSSHQWLAVLDAALGYAMVAKASAEQAYKGEIFNLAPTDGSQYSVVQIANRLKEQWSSWGYETAVVDNSPVAAAPLWGRKLCADKAMALLGWQTKQQIDEALHLAALWYKIMYTESDKLYPWAAKQVDAYLDLT